MSLRKSKVAQAGNIIEAYRIYSNSKHVLNRNCISYNIISYGLMIKKFFRHYNYIAIASL